MLKEFEQLVAEFLEAGIDNNAESVELEAFLWDHKISLLRALQALSAIAPHLRVHDDTSRAKREAVEFVRGALSLIEPREEMTGT